MNELKILLAWIEDCYHKDLEVNVDEVYDKGQKLIETEPNIIVEFIKWYRTVELNVDGYGPEDLMEKFMDYYKENYEFIKEQENV